MAKKRGSLFNQFVVALSMNFNEGTKKHSYKKEHGRQQCKVFFSYSDYHHTVDIARAFARYVRENYPDIKHAYQITNTQVAAFLNEKNGTCNMKTLATYVSRLNHLAHALEASDPGVREHGGKSWNMPKPKDYTKEEKVRDLWMPAKDREKLEEYLALASDCRGKRALQIALATGLRVHECVTLRGNGIYIDERVVRGKGKGGRHYETTIREEYIELMCEFKDKYGEQIIADLKASSANSYLHACLKKCGIDSKYAAHRTGIHSIRKNVSQDLYDSQRKMGKTHIEAATIASRNLSHGRYRTDVDRNYIKGKE